MLQHPVYRSEFTMYSAVNHADWHCEAHAHECFELVGRKRDLRALLRGCRRQVQRDLRLEEMKSDVIGRNGRVGQDDHASVMCLVETDKGSIPAGSAVVPRDRRAERVDDVPAESDAVAGPVRRSLWLPGARHDVKDAVALPRNITPGIYSLDVGILDSDGGSPHVALAIEGRRADLWYTVSQIVVTSTQ